jgi:hypothetical protein
LIYNTAMRRVFIVLFILILTIACRTLISTVQPTQTATSPPLPATASQTLPPPSATPSSTISPTVPAETDTPETQVTPTSTQAEGITDIEARFHPDGELYVGDLVSLEVIIPPGINLDDSEISVQVDPPEGKVIGSSGFGPFGIQGRQQATMIWAWDTSLEQSGEHILEFAIQPEELTFSETVTLLPANELPPDEAGAVWSSATSDCCTVWYMTHTASDRDLFDLLSGADIQARSTIEQMQVDFSQTFTITILPRLLGHGGFAANEIHVSYLERNYATNSWDMVLHHEMVHILDRRLGGDLRPHILVEGLAVYLSDGHYKQEDLLPRAAALLPDYLDWYMPLNELTRDFYALQHEIGYLEAGALVAYMVERWGWEAYSSFYRDIHPQESGGHTAAIEAALLTHFGLSYAELEEAFISALQAQPEAAFWMEDVRLTVTYYDTLRRYQQILDPSAYFRTAWLLDTVEMRNRDILADYYRHPSEPANIALETLMIAASDEISAASFNEADTKLAAVNAVLEAIDRGDPQPFSVHPLASDYLGIVNAVIGAGYQAQRIDLQDRDARVLVTTNTGGELFELYLNEIEGNWMVLVTDRLSLTLP